MSELERAAIEGAASVVKDLCRDFLKGAMSGSKRLLNRSSVDFETAFTKYLDRTARRLTKIKTLINPNSPVNLETSYVPAIFTRGEDDFDSITEIDIIRSLKSPSCIVITGVGGSGKSVFLKHLFLKLYNESVGKIPVYIELRSVGSTELVEYLRLQIANLSPQFDSELFEYALSKGKFAFLMDAMDEVEPDRREALAADLLRMTYTYGDNSYIITSRPDIQFQSWNEFDVYSIRELSKLQVKSLIKKIKWDKDLKKSFNLAIDSGLYDTHKPFLSNPLLCTIMLMTFGEGSDIPSTMHVFFARAYDVLFYRHDAMKEVGYRRKLKTSLGEFDFRKLVSSFSTFTYLDHGSAFAPDVAILCAQRAIELESLSANPHNFLDDFSQAVSIILDESDRYSYIHRTFQEYFVALFLSDRSFPEWPRLIDRILVERNNDTVIQLLIDMNRDKFDRDYLRRKLRHMVDAMKSIDLVSEPAKMFGLFFSGFGVNRETNSITSWYLGSVDDMPSLHNMLDILFWRFKYSFYTIHDYSHNWPVELGVPERKDIVFRNISNTLLIGSPIQSALFELRNKVSAFEREVLASEKTQDRLLSSLLPSDGGHRGSRRSAPKLPPPEQDESTR